MVIKLLYLHGFLICLWWYLCCWYCVSKRKWKLILVTVYMSFHSTIFDCNYLYICRQFLKAGFCSQQSQSCRWSDKIAYDLVKIANWSCKQCGKDDGIVLGRVRMFPFFFHLHNDIIGYYPVETRLFELEAVLEEPTNHKVQKWSLSLVYSSVSVCTFDNAVFTSSQAMET